MELNQLRAFIAVLDSGSMLGGSRCLGVSRTTVHKWIDALEQSLQVELLVRTPQGVEATDFGRHFALGARALIRDAGALERSVVREREEVLGQLHLRISVGMPSQFLTAFPALFHQRYPHIGLRVEITSEPTQDVPPDVDFIMHFGPRVPSGSFTTFVLARFEERLLASKAYLDQHGRPQTPAQLHEHRLLSWRPPGEEVGRWPLRDGGSLQVEPVLVINDPPSLHLMVAQGRGIAYVPDATIVPSVVPRDQLEVVLPEHVGRESSVHVLVPAANAGTPRGRAAVRLLRDLVRGLLCRELE